MKRMLCAIALAIVATGVVSAMDNAPTTPFDKALLARAVPDDRHEAEILAATLRERNRPQSADALETWLTRRDLERVFGRAVTAGSVDEAIRSSFSDLSSLNSLALTELAPRFPIDFLEGSWPAETDSSYLGTATRLAPGVLQWNSPFPGRAPQRFDVSVRIGNTMNFPVSVKARWSLNGWMFICPGVDIPANQSVVVTCLSNLPINLSDAHIAGDLIALKASTARANVLSRSVVIPSMGFKMCVSMSAVVACDNSVRSTQYVDGAEARRRIATAPCEATGDCGDRPLSKADAGSAAYKKLAILAALFAGILGVRLWRGSSPESWLFVPWLLYAIAGVLSIMLAIMDPPQPGLGDGIVHGAIGQLALFALATPWSSIIVTIPGNGSPMGLLTLAVLANILYGAILVFAGDRKLS